MSRVPSPAAPPAPQLAVGTAYQQAFEVYQGGEAYPGGVRCRSTSPYAVSHTSSTWSCCGGTALMAMVQVAVIPSLSVTVRVTVYMPARSTKNPVVALVGLVGFEVEPAGREVTAQLYVTVPPSGSEPLPLSVTVASGVVLMPAPQLAIGGPITSGHSSSSSAVPSQSSSRRLPHTSVLGPIEPLQLPHAPAAQVWVPATHSPTSVPHFCDSPSSVLPSQSLSLLSQISVAGPVDPLHGP